MSDLRETLSPGRDAGFGEKPQPKPKPKKTTKAAEPAPEEE